MSAPIEISSTPVSAIARTFSSVTPPDASSRARPLCERNRGGELVRRHVVEEDRVDPRRERLRDLGERVALDLDGKIGRRAQPLDRARVPSRLRARWLSFTSTPSSRPKRWFRPPPQATACFSSRRRPGVVLRVSRIATPRSRHGVDVAARQRRDAGEPAEEVQRDALAREDRAQRARDARRRPSCARRACPSSTSASNRTSGSSARKTASAAASPQTTPASFTSSSAVPRASASTVASVVTSPAPTSSASAAYDDPFERVGCYSHVSNLGSRPRRRTTWRSSDGSLHREVRPEMRPAALLADERALRDQPREQVRRGPRAARARRSRGPARSPARAHRAARRSTISAGLRFSWTSPATRGMSREAGLGEGGERGPAAEDEALEERVRRQAVRAVDARGSALAGGVEAGKLSASVEVGDDPSDRVVRRRRDGNRRLGGVVASLGEASHEARKPCAVDLAQVEERGAARRDVAGDDVPRRELVGEALAALVEEQRALAAECLGEEQRRVHERRRMELHELEIRDGGAGAIGRSDAVADGARRVRRPTPERRSSTGGEQRRTRTDRAAIGHDARRSGPRSPQAPASAHLRRPRSADGRARAPRARCATRSPVAAPPAWTTRRRLWPPSSPRSSSKSTPSSTRSRIRAGASP